MKKTWLAAAATAFLACSSASFAQWAVFDAANFSQNLLTAARELQQIDNQIQQLQNEAQMLVNQGRNLTSLKVNSLSQLLTTLASTNQLIAQAQGLTFNVAQSQATFSRSRAIVRNVPRKPCVACLPWNPMSRSALLRASRCRCGVVCFAGDGNTYICRAGWSARRARSIATA